MREREWSQESKDKALDILHRCEEELSKELDVPTEEARSLMHHHVDMGDCGIWNDWFERPLYLEKDDDGFLMTHWVPHLRSELKLNTPLRK